MSNPIAKVSLYRFDGELRGTVLRTYEGASLLPLGDHDVYAAPVTAANDQQNTQQPVAYRWRFGSESLDTRWHYSDVPLVPYSDRTVESLYTAPPAPRDVLMAAMRDAVADLKAGAFLADCGTDIAFRAVDYSAIADRYASKVQPEPVNQQLLEALKLAESVYRKNVAVEGEPSSVLSAMQAAIAAAEAAQPVGAEVEQLKVAANNWPAQCPITRRDFFMEIDGVPTYGGPYDSYTIPEMTGEATQPFHERELFVRRYDHDLGGWVDDEFIPLRVIHEDVLMELEEATQQPASAQPEGQQ